MASNRKRVEAENSNMGRVLFLTRLLLQPHRDVKPKAEISTPGIIGIVEQVVLLDDVLVIGYEDPE